MIGLGKWGCKVDTMFFKGDAFITLFDDNGSYGFEIEVPGVDIPDVTVKQITEEGGDTINAVAQTSLLPGKDIELVATFDGDTFTGTIKIPFVGKVKLKDGHRI